MLELYLDTANIQQITRFQACLPIKGITTNPSILAKEGIGVNQLLSQLAQSCEDRMRFHVQVLSQSVDEIVDEAVQLTDLPYDIVVKIPATEIGIAAIKKLKQQNISTLATAIYSVQQGFLAAMAGADYLAPYVNRIDNFGEDGIAVVAQLQYLLTQQELQSCVLPASFKNTRQVLEVLKTGVGAITLPVDIMEQMFFHPATPLAIDNFTADWQQVFKQQLAFQS